MSNKDLSRRTRAEVYFAGVDISASILKYLISLTYTDNEEDAADDLQIKLQDRDDTWLTKWLDAAVQSAASSSTPAASSVSSVSQYKVTAKSGLNVRSGPGTSHGKLGALAFGATIDVSGITDGWASIKYSGKDAYVSATYIEAVEGAASEEASDEPQNKGLSVQAVIVRENWRSDGKDDVLDCGQFELDSITASGPPAEVTIKCTSLPFNAQIRQTKKSKAWEGYSLSKIAEEMAAVNGMSCLYESASDPEYSRLEQITESDIAFLTTLCHNAGISLKATNNILVLFDQATFEAKDSIMTLTKGGGKYLKYKLASGSADTQYDSCRVSYTSPSGTVISAIAYTEDYKADKKDKQQLEISAKINSVGEAQELAAKSLRLKNKFEYSASFTMPGDPALVAGVTVMLEKFGPWNGKYIIKQAKHSIGGSGYTTQITLRRVLEGY